MRRGRLASGLVSSLFHQSERIQKTSFAERSEAKEIPIGLFM
jgi:hypothetical protein